MFTGMTDTMTTEMTSLVLEHLRAIRSDVQSVHFRLDALTARVSSLENSVASLHGDMAAIRVDLANMGARIDRVEQRLFTGGVAGIIALAVLLLAVVPHVPAVESSRAWRRSALVHPLHVTFENLIGPGARRALARRPSAGLDSMGERLRSGVKGTVARLADRMKG